VLYTEQSCSGNLFIRNSSSNFYWITGTEEGFYICGNTTTTTTTTQQQQQQHNTTQQQHNNNTNAMGLKCVALEQYPYSHFSRYEHITGWTTEKPW